MSVVSGAPHLPDPPPGEDGLWRFGVPLLIAAGLILLSRHSFLWFHTLAELFAVVVGVSLYLVARASYTFNRNAFLLFLAQGFFWAATIDAIHTVTYAGMGLTPTNDPDPATQLWLCARLLEAATLLLAPMFLGKRSLPAASFALFAAATVACFALVFTDLFPSAYQVGSGLTPFKVGTEYLIIALLALAAWRLYRHREALAPSLYRTVQQIVALTMVSEFAFTLYLDVDGLSNLVGHLCKLWAFWLLMTAVRHWMLARPFQTLARDAFSFDAIPLPVLLVDAKGIVNSCNHAALSLRHDGGLGRPLHAVWHPAGLPIERCPVCMALQTGWDVHTELHDPEHGRWTSVHLQQVARDGQVFGFVCVHEDITQRRRTETHLAQSDRLEVVGQMTGGLAHDFNNLLGIVLGGMELAAPALAGDARAAHHLELARKAARQAVEITRGLLTVARRQTLEPRTLDVSESVREMLPLIEQTAGKGIAVEARIGQPLLARADPSGLGNALLNLVVNARDAMPEGGTLALETFAYRIDPAQPQPHSALAAALAPGPYAVLRVRDSGCGMTPEVLAHVFEPFYTTKERGRGTGLGLAMVYGFARQSGGGVGVDSAPGHGSCFDLYLPAETGAQAQVRRDGGEAEDTPLPTGQGEHVLLVDDEEGLLEVATAWLKALGYTVRATSRPEEARRWLAGAGFDLLLTDVVMPGGLDGIALAAQARFLCPEIRVLFASGHVSENWTEDAPCLEKPYNRAELARAVATALAQKRASQG